MELRVCTRLFAAHSLHSFVNIIVRHIVNINRASQEWTGDLGESMSGFGRDDEE